MLWTAKNGDLVYKLFQSKTLWERERVSGVDHKTVYNEKNSGLRRWWPFIARCLEVDRVIRRRKYPSELNICVRSETQSAWYAVYQLGSMLSKSTTKPKCNPSKHQQDDVTRLGDCARIRNWRDLEVAQERPPAIRPAKDCGAPGHSYSRN